MQVKHLLTLILYNKGWVTDAIHSLIGSTQQLHKPNAQWVTGVGMQLISQIYLTMHVLPGITKEVAIATCRYNYLVWQFNTHDLLSYINKPTWETVPHTDDLSQKLSVSIRP